MIDFARRVEDTMAPVGPLLPRPHAAACPQLAKADAASPARPLVKRPKLAWLAGQGRAVLVG
jgi:hypothetical protein